MYSGEAASKQTGQLGSARLGSRRWLYATFHRIATQTSAIALAVKERPEAVMIKTRSQKIRSWAQGPGANV